MSPVEVSQQNPEVVGHHDPIIFIGGAVLEQRALTASGAQILSPPTAPAQPTTATNVEAGTPHKGNYAVAA